MIKYVLPLLLTSAAFADSPFNPDPMEAYERAYCKTNAVKKVRRLDITEILGNMGNLVDAAKTDPYNIYIFIFMMEEEIQKCKTWMSLQHSD